MSLDDGINNGLPRVVVSGNQVSAGRRKVIDRGMDILLEQSKDVDWTKWDICLSLTQRTDGGT